MILNDLFASYKLEFIQKIGQGTNTKVYKAFDKATKQTVAVKIQEHKLDKSLLALEHRNVVKILRTHQDLDLTLVVIQYQYGGQLGSDISETKLKYICKDILQGLLYLHEHQIIHGNLKFSNLLISKDGIAKLTDYGKLGSSKANDILNLGSIILNLTGQHKKSAQLSELISSMTKINPIERYNAQQALTHPWITGNLIIPMSFADQCWQITNTQKLLQVIKSLMLLKFLSKLKSQASLHIKFGTMMVKQKKLNPLQNAPYYSPMNKLKSQNTLESQFNDIRSRLLILKPIVKRRAASMINI